MTCIGSAPYPATDYFEGRMELNRELAWAFFTYAFFSSNLLLLSDGCRQVGPAVPAPETFSYWFDIRLSPPLLNQARDFHRNLRRLRV
jgi:hypothetical protein